MASSGTTTHTLPSITQTASGAYSDNAATGTHTLASITQSLTGSYPLQELLISSANASSDPFEFATEELVGNPIATSVLSVEVTESLSSTVSTSSTPTFAVITELTDIVQASESFPNSVINTLLKANTAYTSDEIIPSVSFLETSLVTTSTSFEISRDISLSDTFIGLGNIVSPGVLYNQSVESTVNIGSSIFGLGLSEAITNTANASSTLTPWSVIEQNLGDTLTISESLTGNALLYASLLSVATLNESFNFEGAIANELLCSETAAKDWLWAKDFDAVAWVLNTQSGGLTNYNNFGFSSLAFHGGKLYATSPDGFFELGGDNDDGRQIASTIQTGFLDFGVEEKKRISDVFVGYTGGDLEFDVETYDGPQEVYTYEMEYREADAPRNSRVKPGKGLNSRFWRFTIRNTGGADFQIHDIAVEVAKSNRRL